MTVAIIFAVVSIAAIGGFLYLIAAIVGDSRVERERILAYYTELVIQAEENITAEREAYIQERNSLLERIQRPEFTPPVPFSGPPVISDEINDDLHLVGTVRENDSPPPPDDAA
jgi:hypothetical protein